VGGIVSYADSSKRELLDVSEATLSRHGAVSEEAAREMARGARKRFGAGMAAAVTGIAGPGGATPGKPVGTVCFAVAGPQEGETVKRRMFGGDRSIVRRAAALFCLHLVRRQLLAENAFD
jgi:nicotinamide-nucleotide amidase